MMKKILTKDDVLHLAKLSKLRLTDKEIERYWKQLEETIEYVENLNQLETKKVKPTSQITNLTNIFFKDGEKNKRALTVKQVMENASKKKDNYFIVRRIF